MMKTSTGYYLSENKKRYEALRKSQKLHFIATDEIKEGDDSPRIYGDQQTLAASPEDTSI